VVQHASSQCCLSSFTAAPYMSNYQLVALQENNAGSLLLTAYCCAHPAKAMPTYT
jgi:hypothetical protein